MSDKGGDQINTENIKVTLLGSSGVGKTCIIKRFTDNSYDDNVLSTSGANYSQKFLEIENRKVLLDLWDTAGQEKYRSLGRHFYKDAYIVCLVYDITNPASFKDLQEKWYKDLQTFGEKYTVIAVVGSKSDCYENEEVSEDEARKYAEEINAIFMLTSAKTGNNIDNLFDALVRKYLGPEFIKKVEEMKIDKGEVKKVTQGKVKEEKKESKCC